MSRKQQRTDEMNDCYEEAYGEQLDRKTKIIERSGFDEVMTVDDSSLAGNSSDYNTIKDNIVYKSSNR